MGADIVAPSGFPLDLNERQRARPGSPTVLPKINRFWFQNGLWRGAIAFPLVGAHAATAEGAGCTQCTGNDQASMPDERTAKNPDRVRNPHGFLDDERNVLSCIRVDPRSTQRIMRPASEFSGRFRDMQAMPDPISILLLIPDQGKAAALADQLMIDDIAVVTFAMTPFEPMAITHLERIDVALLMGLDISGLALELRGSGYRGPILGLASSQRDEMVSEFVPPPFRFSFLLSRIRAVILAYETRNDTYLSIGSSRLVLGSRLLIGPDGVSVKLTDKEVAILRFMHRAGGQIVSREMLLAEVWGYNPEVTTHTLETHIYRLRQKIEADPVRAERLLTEPRGYRLVLTNSETM